MSDKPFKQFERTCAALINGVRFPANQGGKVDVKSDRILGQCKLVQALSLAEMTRLVVEIEAEAEKVGKRGMLFVKLRSGKGRPTPLLVVMSGAKWRAWYEPT